ncbi:unnamed protein product [Linum tenue]|uniref:Uncharacterized protein n=2 Tax=Linum tenue TaxID=586396 RepID=A0AAV0H1P3_9ROSI|nr:unnamed protein product [Linum tenue]
MEIEARRDQNCSNKSSKTNNDGISGAEDTGYVDWKGRPSNPHKHGGMRAASFVLGLQAFEIMAIAAVGNNLITYVMNEMHFSLSESANIVTNFVGTVFILALLGGYLSDSYLGCFWTMLIFGFVELSGFILLSVQAHVPQLKPPKCNNNTSGGGMEHYDCEEAKGFKALIFFVALYLVALGSGCVKPNMIAHGADQFQFHHNHNHNQDQDNRNHHQVTKKKHQDHQSKQLSTYFNSAYFAFSMGELVALTLLVWVQTHSGMDVGFGVSAAVMAMGLISLVSGTLFYRNKPPQRTILTPIAQVFVAAFLKRNQISPSTQQNTTTTNNVVHAQRFRFLDKASMRSTEDNGTSRESPWRLCTTSQVQQVKILISVIPIFACTIVFNTILAQLQTFSVQQGRAMDTKLTPSFDIPPASLQAIPYVILIVLVPLYDAVFVPAARKLTGHESGITPLQRIGSGLFLATFSMVAAAAMENKRREAAVEDNVRISIFWITPQFLVFGLSEMLTAVGLIEFFYKQSLKGMQSFLTAITYCSYSFGFYLSSVLVSSVNKITSRYSSSGHGWLGDNDLNNDRLDLFYWMLAVLSFLNFLNYLFWANWYSPCDDNKGEDHMGGDDEAIP